jgi:hypothetical protein
MRVFRFVDIIPLFLSRRWPREELLRSIPFIPALDPIREAVVKGIAAGNAKRRPTREIRMRARAIRGQARATSCHETAISELLVFVSDYPGAEEFQKVIARLFMRCMTMRERFMRGWESAYGSRIRWMFSTIW